MKLKNGGDVSEGTVERVVSALRELFDERPLVALHARLLAQDPEHQCSDAALSHLAMLGFLRVDRRMLEEVRDVILSSVGFAPREEEDELLLTLSDPASAAADLAG